MWASEEAHHIYGLNLTPDQTLPLPLVQSLAEEQYRSMLDLALNDLIMSDQKPYNVEFFIRRHDNGAKRAVQSIARLSCDVQGRPVRVSGTIQDITERKLVQEEILKLNQELEQRVRARTAQLEVANKELEAFAYSVSHDLRAPLRALNGYSQMLSEDYNELLDDTGRKYLRQISAASVNMSRLIDDILKLSRITRSEMKIEQVDLSGMVGQIAVELQSTQPERQVDWQITPGLIVQADRALMHIALTNLLANAWKFTSKTPLSQIIFGLDDQNIIPVFFVHDNGAGFDMTYQHKLFNAFQRLHSDQDFEGTGIGLAIVQRIIARHGGKIWAEGAVGKGAVFFFTLFD
jgi:PAS domain S-box-containing protein